MPALLLGQCLPMPHCLHRPLLASAAQLQPLSQPGSDAAWLESPALWLPAHSAGGLAVPVIWLTWVPLLYFCIMSLKNFAANYIFLFN